MLQSFRTVLLLTLLLTAVVTPALARVVIGASPAVTPGVGDPALRGAIETELSSRLGDTVVVRSFNSETEELDWLIRFRELDAALVGHSLMQRLPAGTLLHLADLPSAVAVTHPGITAGQHATLSRAFRSLLEDERGRQLFNRLAGTTKAVTAKPATSQRAVPEMPPAAPKPGTAPVAPPAVEISAPTSPASGPTAATASSTQPTAMLPPATATAPLGKTPPKQPSVAAKPKAAAPPPMVQPPIAPAGRKRTTLLLVAALVIMIGISAKIALLMRHWQRKHLRQPTPPQPPSAEDFAYQGVFASPAPADTATPFLPLAVEANTAQPQLVPAVAVEAESPAGGMAPDPGKRPAAKRRTTPVKPAEDAFPPPDDTVVEQGRLGRIKVPALFKRCAELPRPVVLRVRAGDNETAVHFAAGQICHASSRNWRTDEGPRQWSKLGYLMVRDGLISETQRDQALELVERQPALRFAAALQQLGALDLEALRHILARQAKTVIYALILFSSGEYRIEADSGEIPAEESIALQVEALIREASHHQSEWTAIRKVLPNLGTRLDFTPDGREKLEQVRLSVPQQLLLSQIDGQAQIGTLSCDSTMMDYEACRFLYLMVKAGVLQIVPPA